MEKYGKFWKCGQDDVSPHRLIVAVVNWRISHRAILLSYISNVRSIIVFFNELSCCTILHNFKYIYIACVLNWFIYIL